MVLGAKKRSILLTLSAGGLCLFLILFTAAHGEDAGMPSILMDQGKKYLIDFDKNYINICTEGGKKIGKYKTGDSAGKIFSSCISDLDNDKTDEILLITGQDKNEFGEYFLMLKPEVTAWNSDGKISGNIKNRISLKQIYKCDMKEINPWKVQTCDVDGDGTKEISAGVFKTARFHPVMAKRPFIYNWTGGYLSPKWLGSRLARPFDDYIFLDINSDGKDELVSTEHLADGRKAVNTYAWKGFGFESTGESKGYDDISDMKKGLPDSDTIPSDTAAVIRAKVKLEGKYKWIELYFENDKLVETKVD